MSSPPCSSQPLLQICGWVWIRRRQNTRHVRLQGVGRRVQGVRQTGDKRGNQWEQITKPISWILIFKNERGGGGLEIWVWRPIPVNSESGRLKLQALEVEASLSYTVRPCPQSKHCSSSSNGEMEKVTQMSRFYSPAPARPLTAPACGDSMHACGLGGY